MPSAGVAAMKRWVALRTVRVGVGKGGEWVEEILHKFIGGLPHYLESFNYPRWCRISSIHSMYIMLLYIYTMFVIF